MTCRTGINRPLPHRTVVPLRPRRRDPWPAIGLALCAASAALVITCLWRLL